MAKKPISVSTSLTYEEMVKAIKAVKGPKVIVGKEIPTLCTVKHIKTRIPTLDYLGGLVEGRVTIFAGKTGSGKSTMTLLSIAAMQRKWREEGYMRFIIYVDSEGSFDEPYATALGVDCDWLNVIREKCIEDAFEKCDDLISLGFYGALIIDSLDTMIARKVDESGYGNTMGGTAGAVSMHLPKLFSRIVEFNITTIIIKQARVKMGFTGGAEVITFNGGYFLRHIADSIFLVNRLSSKDLAYVKVSIKAEKTRSSRMGLSLEIPLGRKEIIGVDVIRDLMSLATLHGKVAIAGGGWINLDLPGMEEPLRLQGVENCIAYIREHPDVAEKFEQWIYKDIIDVSTIICKSVDNGTVFIDEDDDKKIPEPESTKDDKN